MEENKTIPVENKTRQDIISSFLKEIGSNEKEVTFDFVMKVLNLTSLTNLQKAIVEDYFKTLYGKILLYQFFYLAF